MLFVNDFIIPDGKLYVHFLGHPSDIKKSDAFIIQYGREFWLIDSGMSGTVYTIEYLLGIRSRILESNAALSEKSLSEQAAYKLKINAIVSHFHNDHVCALIESILPNELIFVENLYLGPKTQVADSYNKISKNGDVLYRGVVLDTLARYQPECKVHVLPFGKENMITVKSEGYLDNELVLTLCPPTHDWGYGERLDYMLRNYAIDEANLHRLNLFTLNSASVWVHARLGVNSFLFTADTMKKRSDLNDEPMDIMTEAYREIFGSVTVVKYVHHGIARDFAANDILSFRPKHIVFTSNEATAPGALLAAAPDVCKNIRFHNCGSVNLVAECDAGSAVTFKIAI